MAHPVEPARSAFGADHASRPSGRGPTETPTKWQRLRNWVMPYDYWPCEVMETRPVQDTPENAPKRWSFRWNLGAGKEPFRRLIDKFRS